MVAYKRKRRTLKSRTSYKRRVPSGVVPGFTRRSGFYGRYTGSSAENKFFDTAISFTADITGEVPATGQLNLIPQGVTESQRIGRKCTLKSLQIRLNSFFDPAANNLPAILYLYVVLDTQANGAAAAVTDVMTSSVMGTALLNLANSDRFVILKRYTREFSLGAGVDGAYGAVSHTWNHYMKLNIPIEFSSTTGAIGEIKSNNIFLLAGSDGNTDDLITVTGTARVRYSDR